ncbi:MAG: tryptophan--tRNA ligase [Candidatus Aenigmatarchaeota archaeon]
MIKQKKFLVTPWEVRGEVDYEKLIKEFGVKRITDELLERIKKHTKELHFLLRRKIFFSHRDMDWILERYENGEKFFLYTGRGPSGHTHIGHLIPWIFTSWLQKKFDAELYFQMTDDEKFLVKPELSLQDTIGYTYDNVLDVIACDFDYKKTFIFSNTEYAKTQYKIAIQIAKHVTFSTVKSIFGFKNTSNIGIVFFPAIQAVPCFLPSVLKGKNIPCLIPAAIDQSPYWRMARDVAPKLNFYKPAEIHSKFFPGLGKGGKMSSSEPETAIFTSDTEEKIERKVMNAFDAGQPTIKEQKEKGGNPELCPVYQYYYFLFEEDDKKVQKIFEDCKKGNRLCGECKEILSERIKKFIKEHQKKREDAKNKIDKFMLRD